MPIVASMGGNAGTQALTVTVRAIATRSLSSANIRPLRGARGAGRGLQRRRPSPPRSACSSGLFFRDVRLGLVIAIAMIGNLVVAGFAGALIPIGLEKLKVDPALASGTFVTTTTDVFGFFAFLGLGEPDAAVTPARREGGGPAAGAQM